MTPQHPVSPAPRPPEDGAPRDGEVDRLFAAVYDELHRQAQHLARRGSGETLRATALVNEAYLKLAGADVRWESREHFVRIAARAMRQVLINAAQARRARKRGGGAIAVTLGEGAEAGTLELDELITLDDALNRLAMLDDRAARVVEFRFFTGLTTEETAAALGVSEPTIKRGWRVARAWLRREMRSSGL